MMKTKWTEPFRRMHWSAKTVVETGTAMADALLLAACAWFSKNPELSVQMAQTAVYLFSVGIVSGLFLDVVAKRTGAENEDENKENKL